VFSRGPTFFKLCAAGLRRELLVNEIVVDAAEADAVAAENIARLQAVAKLAVKEELVAIRQQPAMGTVLVVETALHPFRNPAQRQVLLLVRGQWLTVAGGLLQKFHLLDERVIGDCGG